jgi:hypothetical protein
MNAHPTVTKLRQERSFAAHLGALAVLLIPAAACMQTPGDGDTLASTSDPVIYSGTVSSPGATVIARAATSSGGAAAEVGRTLASDTPNDPSARILVYSWSLRATIPASRWRLASSPDALGCSRLTTYASAESRGSRLNTANNTGTNQLFGYTPFTAGAGGLPIHTQAEADALRCVHVFEGDLTIADSTDHAISLPSLERVTGNLSVSYPSQAIKGTQSSPGCTETRQLHAPALREIGGNLRLDVHAGHDFQYIDLGLEAVESLGQNLTVNATGSPDIALAGLDRLQRVAHAVTIHYTQDTGCYSAGSTVGIDGACVPAPARPGLLSALTRAQSVEVTVPTASYCILPNLAQVDGDVVLHAIIPGVNFMTALATVGGDLRFDDRTYGWIGWAPSLASVAGRVVITAPDVVRWPLAAHSPPLTVGGVTIQGSGLTTLSAADLTLVPATAPVVIQGNSSLPRSEICDFVFAHGAVSPVLDPGVTCP